MVFALSDAKVGTMDATLMAKIVDTEAGMEGSLEAAAKRGYVDTIIDAQAVRKQLVYALEMLY